jgi:hypothetical protein
MKKRTALLEAEADEPPVKKPRRDMDPRTLARIALERAAEAAPAQQPMELHSFLESAGCTCDIPARFPQVLDLFKNYSARRRALDRAYRELVAPAKKATSCTAWINVLEADARACEKMGDAWQAAEDLLACYSMVPLVDMDADTVPLAAMPAFEHYLQNVAPGPLCATCSHPRGPREACCTTCQASNQCGFCRALASDDPTFAIMEAGCSRGHHAQAQDIAD